MAAFCCSTRAFRARSLSACARSTERSASCARNTGCARGNEVAEGIDALRAILESRSTEQILGATGCTNLSIFCKALPDRDHQPPVGGVFRPTTRSRRDHRAVAALRDMRIACAGRKCLLQLLAGLDRPPHRRISHQGSMKLLTVRHVTTYRYRQPVAFGEHRMMLRPRDSYDQRLIEARLDITPEPATLRWMHDVFGNCVALARFAGPSDELRFDSTIRLDHSADQRARFPARGLRARLSRSPMAPRSSPTCCARSSGNISTRRARSIAGRGSSCAAKARPARGSCWPR